MSKSKKGLIITIILVILTWCTTIFNLSGMNSESSNGASTGIVEKAISRVLDATNAAGITDAHPDEEKLAKAATFVNAPLRKVVHATVYFVLALLLLIVGRVIFGSRKYLLTCLITILLCFAFAMTDEYHQTFVEGRTGQILDVIIDTAGACVGTLLFSSYFLAWRIGRNATKSRYNHPSSTIHSKTLH